MNTTRHTESVEVILNDQRRRRWSLPEKAVLVRRTYEPGMSVSLVAREEGAAASLLFQWRKLERQGALTAVSASESVVLASELAATRAEIAKFQRVLGKKTLENEILKEAVEYAAEKSGLRARPCCTGKTVTATFAKDCCERKVIAWRAWEGKGLPGEPAREMLIEAVERRFGTVETVPVNHYLKFLSDNGGAYIAADTRSLARSLGLKPINTPV